MECKYCSRGPAVAMTTNQLDDVFNYILVRWWILQQQKQRTVVIATRQLSMLLGWFELEAFTHMKQVTFLMQLIYQMRYMNINYHTCPTVEKRCWKWPRLAACCIEYFAASIIPYWRTVVDSPVRCRLHRSSSCVMSYHRSTSTTQGRTLTQTEPIT